jgi:hypothetical protein
LAIVIQVVGVLERTGITYTGESRMMQDGSTVGGRTSAHAVNNVAQAVVFQVIVGVFALSLGTKDSLVFEYAEMVGCGGLLNAQQFMNLGDCKFFAPFKVAENGNSQGMGNGLEHVGRFFQLFWCQILYLHSVLIINF